MLKRKYVYIPLIALLVGFVGRTLYYYRGFYSGPDVPTSQADRFEVRSESLRPPLQLEPVTRTVLVDDAHRNNFDNEELTVLFGRIASAGGQVETLRSGENLRDQLRSAGAYIIIANQSSFGSEQVTAVEEFVRKGGRLVIIGDPTRLNDINAINSLAGHFGVTYQDDYLYNLIDNDGNYLNVILTNFEDSAVTEGLDSVIVQTAHSLRVTEGGIALGDENTYSSLREQPGDVTAVALTTNNQVLALPDMTFLTGPYNTFADNDRFIDNIVTFMLGSQRTFDVSDFPYYFNAPTDVVYSDTLLLNANLEDASALRDALLANGIEATLQSERDVERPAIIVGLYDDIGSSVLTILERDGVTVSDDSLSSDDSSVISEGSSEGQITIDGVGSLERGGSVLFHLRLPEDGPYQLYILGVDQQVLSDGLSRLLAGDIGGCLITSATALCALGEPDEGGEAVADDEESLGVLVVSDDAGSPGVFGITSAEFIRETLLVSTPVTVVSTLEDGVPTADEMLIYDAVFWSIGDHCCLAPSEEGVEAILEYLDSGGALFISGANLGLDWGESEFYLNYLGAIDIGDASQFSLIPEQHPISRSFSDEVFFEPFAEDLLLDVIDTEVATVAFRRGFDEFADAPSLIAYEQGDSRVAYAAFPLYFLSEDDIGLLLNDALDWLLFG